MHTDTAGDEETTVSHQGDHSLGLLATVSPECIITLHISTGTIKLERNHHIHF